VAGPGADRAAQPDFLGAFQDGDQGGVGDADRADQQTDQRQDQEQAGQIPADLRLQGLRGEAAGSAGARLAWLSSCCPGGCWVAFPANGAAGRGGAASARRPLSRGAR
jgi:hypothetical protein